MESDPMAERANAVTVTSDDLVRVLEQADKVRHGPEAVLCVVVGLFSDDAEKAVAVLARVLALARLVSCDGLKGWTLRADSTDDVFTDEIVLTVAAEWIGHRRSPHGGAR